MPRAVPGASYSRVTPTPVRAPSLLAWSDAMGSELGLTRPALGPGPAAEILAGNRALAGMRPYAARYGGHQFGHWAGQLGDGRAITLGEVLRSRRPALGAAAEGRRADAVLAHAPTGAPCCARRCASSCAARRCTTSGVPDHARAEPGGDRRTGRARHVLRRPTRRPSRAPSSAASRRRSSASATSRSSPTHGEIDMLRAARRLLDRHALSRSSVEPSSAGATSRWFEEVCRRTARHGRALDAGRLRPRRDEHRQHVDPRPHHRLRPVRLAGGLTTRRGRPTPPTPGTRRYRFGTAAATSRCGTWRGSARRCRH